MYETIDINFFMSQIDTSSACWLWRGAKAGNGYGHLLVSKGKYVNAHRVSFAFFNGEIPEGHNVCHRCDNPLCVFPGHLFAGSASENVADCVAKGRHRHGCGGAKLTPEQVNEVKVLYRLGIQCNRAIGKQFGISGNQVAWIGKGICWKGVAA